MESDELINEYLQLIHEYTDGQKSGSEFMHEYIDKFGGSEDVCETPDEVYNVLESVFFACDSYCPDVDPEKVVGGIGEEEFLEEVSHAREELEGLVNERDDIDLE